MDTIFYTFNNGCIATDTQIVTVYAAPVRLDFRNGQQLLHGRA